MRILIAIHLGFTEPYGDGRAGGSETWALTMRDALVAMGHEVDLMDSRSDRKPDCYNLILTAHTSILPRFAEYDCPIIHTCHGVLPALEQPVPGADRYVSVSEEVQAHLAARGYESTVIRNPIDCERFRPMFELADPMSVFFYSRYQRGSEKVVKAAFPHADIWKSPIPQADIPRVLGCYSLVIGLGRSALEAMACGCNVIVYDYNGGDGFATPETMLEFRKNNCSGRRYGLKPTPEQLRELAEENYDPATGARLREYVIANNEAKMIAQQYLDLI